MPRRSAADAARTRQSILDAARRRFGETGFGATSTAAIARDAEVSQSALFHHFPDKRALFVEVVRQAITAYDDEVLAAALSASTPVDIVLTGCRRSLELATDPAWARIVAIDAPAVLDEVTLREMDAATGRATTLFGLQFLVSTGDLDPAADLEALATVIYGALTEAAFDIARRPGAVPADQVMAVIARLLAAHAPVPAARRVPSSRTPRRARDSGRR